MKDSNLDPAFRETIVNRITALRREFFDFMWDYTGDLEGSSSSYPDPTDVKLSDYFWVWVNSRLRGRSIVPRENSSEPDQGEEVLERDSREFEEFNQLLPHVFITVIDAVWRNPEVLDANPRNANGSRRTDYHRTITGVLSGDGEHYLPGEPYGALEDELDQMMEGVWPSIRSSFD